MSTPGTPYGLMAVFESPGATLHAAEKVRDAGFRQWQVTKSPA